MSLDFGIRRGIVLGIADVSGDGYSSIVEQHLRGNRRGHVARSVGSHPAQELLPEQIVSRVAERRTHLPAPTASGGHDGGAAASEVFRDQQRQLAALGRNQVSQHGSARLGSARIFIVHQVRQLFPFGGVRSGIIHQASNDVIRHRRARALRWCG